MVNFGAIDVINGFVGGLLLGISSTLNLLLFGALTGVSGFVSTSLTLRLRSGLIWKLTFLIGMMSAFLIFALVFNTRELEVASRTVELYDPDWSSPNAFRLLIGGFLVGFGTRLGNGCTSGHGISGLPRLSLRSFVAVGCFFGMALVTANILHHTDFFELQRLEEARESFERETTSLVVGVTLAIIIAIMIAAWIISFVVEGAEHLARELIHNVIKFSLGFVFGMGLSLSGMSRPSKVRNFLVFDKNWDITLMMVLIGAIGFNLISFQLILRKKKEKPILADEYHLPCNNTKLDWKLFAGTIIFGIGWGTCFFCPGPALLAALTTSAGAFCMIFTVIGMYAFELFNFVLEKVNKKNKEEK